MRLRLHCSKEAGLLYTRGGSFCEIRAEKSGIIRCKHVKTAKRVLLCFSWKICFHYSGRSNPAEEIEFPESNLTEARFDFLPFYSNDYGIDYWTGDNDHYTISFNRFPTMASHQGVLTLALTVVLLALPSLTRGVTLHVRPTSTNTSCPTHPCQTLSEYAQDPGQYFNDSNLTLQFLQGTHTLDINLTITNINQLKIHGTLAPTRVVCNSHVGFTFSNISKLTIGGLAFVACARSSVVQVSSTPYLEKTYYGLHLQSVPTAEITDCTFQDSYGSAFGVVDSRVVLKENNSFLNNCRVCHGSCVDIDGYQSPRCRGGGVFVQRSYLSITGSSSFFNNLARMEGGGVSAWDGSNVYISGNTTFSGNSASSSGGGVTALHSSNVYISGNTIFSGNSASSGGGVTAWNSSNVYISGNTTFIGNSARSDGGGVSALHSSNVYISGNTTFSGNSANYGGGVTALHSSNVYISGNTTFSGNSANYGGGVTAWNSSNVYISGNTTFSGNSANYGGGMTAWHSSNVYICGNTTFIGNSARRGGGGVRATSSNVNISGNTTFIGNSARYVDGGGGVSASSSSNVSISGNTIFSGNSARFSGGGVRATSSNVNISGNTTFIGNSARYVHGGGGGGVSASSSSNVSISGNTIFSGNSARNGGGGVSATSSNVNISGNTTLIGNSAGYGNGGGVSAGVSSNVNISGSTIFTGNSATSGGGLCASSSSNVNISVNTTFCGNSARRNGGGLSALSSSDVDISGNTSFSGNSANDGGGVYAEYRSNVYISGNTTFIGNSANDGDGGALSVLCSNVYIRGNARFSSNSAKIGGCVFAQKNHLEYCSTTSLNLDGNCSFTNCSATNDGGAIHASRIQLHLNGTNVFNANRAKHFGGGLYLHRFSLNIDGDNTFTGNWAGYRGGGIYAQETNISFSGTGLVSGNTAQLDGGGIYADGSNLNFSANTIISSNTAQLGGGIYSDNNTINIDGPSVFEGNVATYYGGGIYTRRTPLILTANNMFNANSAGEGGGIYAVANSTLSFGGVNTFRANRAHVSGGGIWLDHSNLTLSGFNHFVGCVASYEGGAIYSYAATASLTGNNNFKSNTATTGGGLHARWSNVHVTERSKFEKNIAVFGSGIYTDNSTFEFNGSSTFRGNKANYTGGCIYAARSVLNFLGTNYMTENYAARDGGGIYTRDGSVVNLLGSSNFQGNLAKDTGGGISAFRSSFKLAGHNTFESNNAEEGGGFYAFDCTVNFPGENVFITNSASNQGGGFTVVHSTLHLNGSTNFMNNSAASGGGVYIENSKVDIDGNTYFMNNAADSGGGAIYARDSVVELNGKDLIAANTTGRQGAENHASSSTSILQGSSSFMNNGANYGGGIYSERTYLIMVRHNCSYLNNTALQGGAQYFDVYSNFSLHQTAHVYFQGNNAAEFGGAIYVEDVPSRNKCFFHIQNDQLLDLNTTPLVFEKNTAGMRGSVLYGGLLDKCSFTSDKYTSILQLFNISILKGNGDKSHSISSDPTQICFCNNNSKLNCTEKFQSRSIYPGQQVEVSVVAIDQSDSTIPALIHTTVRSGNNLTVSETISYETGENCTSRNYSVTPNKLFNQLEFYPRNRSGDTIHLIVNITFERCPIGFELSTSKCICDHRIWQYTNSCDINTQAIFRNASSTFWLGVLYNNGTPEGFIRHPFCPLDYCTTESKFINLRDPDKQCIVNRSGLLCGKCKEGLSLVLGSSQCKECSNNYLALLIPFTLAGVLLVILLFLLHLTVAAGTLHGLIFYANIVAANHHIFFPQSSNNPASIFIAWLNLDLGIQTCFYNGMDAYAKTWLDLVFPVYIWVIVGFLVYISGNSVTMTKLLGSSPVPVLATLFLLSYAKVLRTIIAALSLTVLHYPHKNVMVWIHDANVSLAKYIPLALAAVLFLLFLFLPYTLLLLLGQWLQSKSHLCLLSWVRNPKLKAVLDTYHAPYKPKHRYWTGLLLLVRCALFLVFAFNISGNNSVNLLVTSSATFGILVWFTLSGVVYKSWWLNALEVSFILNLGILAVATYHVTLSGGSRAAVAYTSVGIAFLTFMGIVTYHIYIRIKSKVQYIQRGYQHRNGNRNRRCEEDGANLEHQCGVTPNIVTHTEVNLRELRSPLDLLHTK